MEHITEPDIKFVYGAFSLKQLHSIAPHLKTHSLLGSLYEYWKNVNVRKISPLYHTSHLLWKAEACYCKLRLCKVEKENKSSIFERQNEPAISEMGIMTSTTDNEIISAVSKATLADPNAGRWALKKQAR